MKNVFFTSILLKPAFEAEMLKRKKVFMLINCTQTSLAASGHAKKENGLTSKISMSIEMHSVP